MMLERKNLIRAKREIDKYITLDRQKPHINSFEMHAKKYHLRDPKNPYPVSNIQ